MKRQGLAIGALLLILLALPLAVLWNPGILVNPTSLRWAAAFLYQRGVQVQWETLTTTFTSPSVLEKNVRLLARHLCVKSEVATGCIPKARLELRFHWLHGLTMFGPAEISAKDWVIALKPAGDEETEPVSVRQWFQRLERVRFKPASLSLNGIRIVTADQASFGAGSVNVTLRQINTSEWNLHAEVTKATGSALEGVNTAMVIRLPQDPARAETPWEELRLQFSAALRERRALTFNGRMAASGAAHVRFDGTGRLVAPRGLTVEARFAGSNNRGKLATEIDASARGALPKVNLVQAKGCKIAGSLPTDTSSRMALEAHCPVTLADFSMPRPLRNKSGFPREVAFVTHATYEMPDTHHDRFKAHGEVELTPLTAELLQWEGRAAGDASGRTSRLSQTLTGAVTFALKVQAPRIQRIAALLRGTEWSIPAPFHVLDGAISCEANSRLALGRDQFNVPFNCATNLTSETQVVKLMAENEFGWDRERKKPRLFANVTLMRTRLQLPYLQLQSMPRLGPDKRIILPDALTVTAPKSAPLSYRVNVRTTAPLELITNLANSPVPVDVPGLTLVSGQPPEGRIVVRNFDVKAFRRNGLINHIALTFPGDTRPIELDGLITIRNVDYNIRVTLLGTVEKPRVVLTSDPPRPESELISSAFFGGSLDEVDSETARSVAETRAALADGAINLISMYYLASTPVESVGYNPESGVFRAKVKLAEGTSLTLGSDLRNQQSLGVRRRLSRNWAVETTVHRDLETDEQSERAMLRWARRY